MPLAMRNAGTKTILNAFPGHRGEEASPDVEIVEESLPADEEGPQKVGAQGLTVVEDPVSDSVASRTCSQRKHLKDFVLNHIWA